MYKRRTFSLIEVLIGLPLFALMLSSTLTNYTSLLTLNKKELISHSEFQKSHYFRLRMKKILFNSDLREGPFKWEDQTLTFHYDNGINQTPLASNQVLGELSLKKGILKLAVSKEIEKQKDLLFLREERFFSGVKEVKYFWGYLKDKEVTFSEDPSDTEELLALKLKITFLEKSFNKEYLFEL
ncbi:MAG: hypothetical protein S4CHLAM7_09870 [Chlamydiae bacterium]|nr:hypothetical protein [Chlamydiota bacterium]